MLEVVGGKHGLALAAGGHGIRGRAGCVVADVVAVAVHVAWPIGLAVGDEQHEVGATGNRIGRDGKRRVGTGVAALDRLHVVVGAGLRSLGDVVLQCATSGRAVVGNQSAVGRIGHLGGDGLGRRQCIVGVVRGVQERRELGVPASSAAGAAGGATISHADRWSGAAVVVVGQRGVVGVVGAVDGDVVAIIGVTHEQG